MRKLIILLVMVAASVLPIMAQQEWQSTSTMQGAGSNLSPQVTAVGATSVSEMATTTESEAAKAPGTSGPRRINPVPAPTPIGDAVLPLLLMAVAFGGVVYLRRRKAA